MLHGAVGFGLFDAAEERRLPKEARCYTSILKTLASCEGLSRGF